jgi:hypothetical protein
MPKTPTRWAAEGLGIGGRAPETQPDSRYKHRTRRINRKHSVAIQPSPQRVRDEILSNAPVDAQNRRLCLGGPGGLKPSSILMPVPPHPLF